MATKQKFRRTDVHKYSKLGVRRKKKQIYRKAKGTDNKIRLKMKGHLRNVSIGFRGEKKGRGLVDGQVVIMVYNLKDLKKIKKEEIGIIGKIGGKKRKEILDYAIKNNIKLSIDAKKGLEKIEGKLKKAKEKKEKIGERKKAREKKKKEKKVKKEDKEVKEGVEPLAKEEAVKNDNLSSLEKKTSLTKEETKLEENVEEMK